MGKPRSVVKKWGTSVREFENFEALLASPLPMQSQSEWVLITQERIDQFAKATGDHQWIHTDPVRAAAGPFKGTIAHGFLTLSLIPQLFEQCIKMPKSSMGVNYGLNKVRFTDVVPVNSLLSARFDLASVEPLVQSQGVQSTWDVELTRQGGAKPVCVAQCVFRHYAG